MDIEEWLNELTKNATRRAIADKTGYAQSTLSRQLERGYLRPEMVIALCRGYGRSPVTGLIETGYLQKWETEGVSIPYALEQATNTQLLDEIMRRSDPEARELFGGQGRENEVVGLAPVEDLPTPPHKSEGWRNKPRPHQAHVADTTPPEPGPGDDGYHDGP